MSRKNFKADLFIEAVRYRSNGQIEWVRAYLRRGPTFSDCVLLSRIELINFIKKGMSVATGQRVSRLASTFINSIPLRLIKNMDRLLIASDGHFTDRDYLYNVPTL